MENKIFKTEIGGREVVVEVGKYCELSNGSCMVRCGDTIVMVNVTMSKQPREGLDYFPLGVDYEEKMYTVGKIPGGFKKREGRPSDKAVLTGRLIDRPLRPLFEKGFYNDVSIVATPLSVDPDIAPEPLAMLGSSVALTISDIPFGGPTGAVVVGRVNDKFVINPDLKQMEKSTMHLTVSGTKDAILMVEAGCNQISEEIVLDGIMFGHEEIKRQVSFQEQIAKELNVKKQNIIFDSIPQPIDNAVRTYADKMVDEMLANFIRKDRQLSEDEVSANVQKYFLDQFEDGKKYIDQVLYNMKKEKVRAKILNEGVRPDGRVANQIRPIWCEVGVLPRVHGSGVFTRGQTQVMTALTLGMLNEAQSLEGLDEEESKRYMHHYNMPPYSTGEARQLRSPGRREIGHGALAERALLPVLPSEEEFPYAIRTVSEVLSSNGSTSQASVCGSTLALMDAGVPISSPVAGIAMGLIKDKHSDKVAILTDIQGLEDFLGDMDFKVAGTEQGITAIQMDMKIHGIDKNILKTALEQARIGRLEILNKMLAVISQPNQQLSKYAPKIITFKIDPDKIREVIGSGGKVINQIIDETGVKIDIDDDGKVFIASSDADMLNRAKAIVLSIAQDVEAGMQFTGKVVKIMEFGAFVELSPNKDGMIHISKLSKERVEKVEDVLALNDMVKVEVIKIDEKNRINLKLIEKL